MWCGGGGGGGGGGPDYVGLDPFIFFMSGGSNTFLWLGCNCVPGSLKG